MKRTNRKQAQLTARVVEFYEAMWDFLNKDPLNIDKARLVQQCYGTAKDGLSMYKPTFEGLGEVYKELHNLRPKANLMQSLANQVFKDLAEHMRIPKARRVFAKLRHLAGPVTNQDLYVCIVNKRTLGDGVAVITLVVDDKANFERLPVSRYTSAAWHWLETNRSFVE